MPSRAENQQSLSARVTLTSGQRNLQGGSVIGDEHGGQPLECALWHPAGALAQVLGCWEL